MHPPLPTPPYALANQNNESDHAEPEERQSKPCHYRKERFLEMTIRLSVCRNYSGHFLDDSGAPAHSRTIARHQET